MGWFWAFRLLGVCLESRRRWLFSGKPSFLAFLMKASFLASRMKAEKPESRPGLQKADPGELFKENQKAGKPESTAFWLFSEKMKKAF